MATFEVKTVSTFELVYLVEAETAEQAVEFALDSDNDSTYYVQKHAGEQPVDSTEIEEIWWTDWLLKQQEKGFV